MPTGVYPRKPSTFDRKGYMRRWYLAHKESEKETSLKRYYIDVESKKEKHREWSKQNREKINEYRRMQYQDPLFKLSMRLRGRFNKAVTRGNERAVDLIGCSIEKLKMHIEAQFKEGMSWDNWSYRGWHIDHIIPVASFNLKDSNELKRAFHYTNLQPMWGKENMKKGARIYAHN